MNSTCGTVADTERRLQERLELALRASHTDVVTAATGAARGIRDHIGSLDKRVGQINLQLEATVERFGAQLRASQESNESTHREACRAELDEAIENSRERFEDVVVSQTESKIAQAQEDLQYQIDATRNDALDRICEAEARMQEKLDEAAATSAESCEAFAKMVDNTSRGFQHLLETKIQAQGELHVAARDDTLDRICQLEARMQAKLDEATTTSAESHEVFAKMVNNASRGVEHLVETKIQASEKHFRGAVELQLTQFQDKIQTSFVEAIGAVESKTSARFENMESTIRANANSMELRVGDSVQAKLDSSISEAEQRLNRLLQKSRSDISAAVTNEVASRVSKFEARMNQSQQELRRKMNSAQTEALTQVETRLMEKLRVSRKQDAMVVESSLKAIEQALDSRVTAAVSRALMNQHRSTAPKAQKYVPRGGEADPIVQARVADHMTQTATEDVGAGATRTVLAGPSDVGVVKFSEVAALITTSIDGTKQRSVDHAKSPIQTQQQMRSVSRHKQSATNAQKDQDPKQSKRLRLQMARADAKRASARHVKARKQAVEQKNPGTNRTTRSRLEIARAIAQRELSKRIEQRISGGGVRRK